METATAPPAKDPKESKSKGAPKSDIGGGPGAGGGGGGPAGAGGPGGKGGPKADLSRTLLDDTILLPPILKKMKGLPKYSMSYSY